MHEVPGGILIALHVWSHFLLKSFKLLKTTLLIFTHKCDSPTAFSSSINGYFILPLAQTKIFRVILDSSLLSLISVHQQTMINSIIKICPWSALSQHLHHHHSDQSHHNLLLKLWHWLPSCARTHTTSGSTLVLKPQVCRQIVLLLC